MTTEAHVRLGTTTDSLGVERLKISEEDEVVTLDPLNAGQLTVDKISADKVTRVQDRVSVGPSVVCVVGFVVVPGLLVVVETSCPIPELDEQVKWPATTPHEYRRVQEELLLYAGCIAELTSVFVETVVVTAGLVTEGAVL